MAILKETRQTVRLGKAKTGRGTKVTSVLTVHHHCPDSRAKLGPFLQKAVDVDPSPLSGYNLQLKRVNP